MPHPKNTNVQAARPGAQLLAVAAISYSGAALAHHPMGGALPANAWQGLLSGLGHPIIGMDHLVFLIAAALLLACSGLRRPALLVLFALGSFAGTLMHAAGWTTPLLHWGVVGTLAVLAALLLRQRVPTPALMAGMAMVAGGLHGHAFGESIIGSETTALVAYLAGLAIIEVGLMLASYMLARRLLHAAPEATRALRLSAAAATALTAAIASHLMLA